MKIGSGLRSICFTIITFAAARGWAQALYSVNAIGYVDVNLVAGSNLVANPLNAGDNTVSNLFRGVPDGTMFIPWDRTRATFGPSNLFHTGSGWTDPSATFTMPAGAFLVLPSFTRIFFVGDITSPVGPFGCYSYNSVDVTIMPGGVCGFCIDACPPAVPEFTELRTWNRSQQVWATFIYVSDFGSPPGAPSWRDSSFNPVASPLTVGEAGMFFPPQPFDTRFPFAIGGGAPGPTVERLSWVRNDPVLSLRMGGNNILGYTLLRSTNLNVGWTVFSNGIVTASNGQIAIEAPVGTNAFGVYKIADVSPLATLFNASRSGTQFRFQFYAEQGMSCSVQRTLSLDSPSWQTIMTLSGNTGLVTVTDNTATAASGYYRLRID